METILAALNWLSTVEGAWSALRFTGLPWLASRIINRWRPCVRGLGFHFYLNRRTLEQEEERLNSRFAGARHVDVLWVKGGKFYDENENLHAVKRVILPNPGSSSMKLFAESVEQKTIGDVIQGITTKAQKYGAKVRWSKEFYCASMNLVDTNRANGWVHVEVVLPYSKPNERPSFTVTKARSPDLVLEFQRIFDQLWDNSDDQKPKN